MFRIDRTILSGVNFNVIWRGLFIVFLLFLLVGFFAHAQTNSETFSIVLSPENPGVNDEVVVTLESDSIDFGLSNITWSLNDSVRLVGVGEHRARFTLGSLGSVYNLEVLVDTDVGEHFSQSVLIEPREVNIVWEAFSYTPPFYRGKALAPSASIITLVALPEIADSDGKKIDPKKLVYSWNQGGVVLGRASGVGKQSIVLQNELLREEPLIASVSVSTPSGSVRVQGAVLVNIHTQEVLVYEKRPLEGVIYSSVLQSPYSFTKDEIVFRAEPYFFSLEDVFGGLLGYRWRVNRKDISVPREEQGNEVTFRREGIETGQAEVLIEIINNNIPFKVLQEAESSFNVLFE